MIINQDKTDYIGLYKRQFKKFLKNNWKKTSGFLILIITVYILFKTYFDKSKILEFSHYIASLGFTGYVILWFAGVVCVNIGLPVLSYEMGIGYILEYRPFLAIFIAVLAKLIGTQLNIFIGRRYFRSYIYEKIQNAKIFKALRRLQQQQSRKSLFLLAILEAPMLLKNFLIAIFNYTYKDIFTMYYPISMVQSMWYVILGSEMGDFTNPNSEHNLRSKIIFYVMLGVTIGTLIYLTIVTKRLMAQEDDCSKKNDDISYVQQIDESSIQEGTSMYYNNNNSFENQQQQTYNNNSINNNIKQSQQNQDFGQNNINANYTQKQQNNPFINQQQNGNNNIINNNNINQDFTKRNTDIPNNNTNDSNNSNFVIKIDL